MERIEKLDLELNAAFHQSVMLREQIEEAVNELNNTVAMGKEYRAMLAATDRNVNISFKEFSQLSEKDRKKLQNSDNNNDDDDDNNNGNNNNNDVDNDESKNPGNQSNRKPLKFGDKYNQRNRKLDAPIRLYEKHRLADAKSIQQHLVKYDEVTIDPRLVPISQLIEEVKKIAFSHNS